MAICNYSIVHSCLHAGAPPDIGKSLVLSNRSASQPNLTEHRLRMARKWLIDRVGKALSLPLEEFDTPFFNNSKTYPTTSR